MNEAIDPFSYGKYEEENAEEENDIKGAIDPFVYGKYEEENAEAEKDIKGAIDPFVYGKCEEGDTVSHNKGRDILSEKEKNVMECSNIFPVNSGLSNGQKKGLKDINKEIVFAEKNNLLLEFTEGYPAKNFYVRPIQIFTYMKRNGKENDDMGEIKCHLFLNQGNYTFTIKKAEIKSLCKIIMKKYPEAIIDFETKNAEKIIETRFREEIQYCTRTEIYFEAGWQVIGGRYVYLRDGIELGDKIKVETGLTLPEYPWDAGLVMETFWRACDLYQDMDSMSAMLAFSLTGVLFRLFKDVGFVPHFTLFLNGKTGSMKTTVGKILFTQLCREEFRENPHRIDSDTLVSLERAVVESGYHTVTLIDDFSPAKTETKKREMQDKVEMVVRMVGDGSSRSRSNVKLEDIRGKGVQGMVVLTGELMGRGLSSNLRCFYCKMERDKVNEAAVTWFQENSHAYTTFISRFADFVGQNFEIIKAFIKGNFNQERKKISPLITERRIVDSTVTLRLSCDILREFLIGYGRMSNEKASGIACVLKQGIENCAYISQQMSTEESPALKYVRAIASLMEMQDIVLDEDKASLIEKSEFDGFYDADYLYFNSDAVHKKVVKFMKQMNSCFSFELREILEILADDKIIKTARNGSGKRTLCVRISLGKGVRRNFMKIEKEIFKAIQEGNYS